MARRVLLLIFVLTLAVAASATKIQVTEPMCDPNDHTVINVGPEALVAGFDSIGPVNGGGSFTFCNKTGQDWSTLVIAINTTVSPDNVVCPSFDKVKDPLNTAQLAFSTCIVESDFPGNVDVTLFGTTPTSRTKPPIFPGIPNNHEFTISFNCNPDVEVCENPPDWPIGSHSRSFPNLQGPIPFVPEPASLLLLGSGLLAVVSRRKR